MFNNLLPNNTFYGSIYFVNTYFSWTAKITPCELLTTNEEHHQIIQTQREHITILLETTKQQQYFITQLLEGSNINKLQPARTGRQTLALSKSVECLRQRISELHKLSEN